MRNRLGRFRLATRAERLWWAGVVVTLVAVTTNAAFLTLADLPAVPSILANLGVGFGAGTLLADLHRKHVLPRREAQLDAEISELATYSVEAPGYLWAALAHGILALIRTGFAQQGYLPRGIPIEVPMNAYDKIAEKMREKHLGPRQLAHIDGRVEITATTAEWADIDMAIMLFAELYDNGKIEVDGIEVPMGEIKRFAEVLTAHQIAHLQRVVDFCRQAGLGEEIDSDSDRLQDVLDGGSPALRDAVQMVKAGFAAPETVPQEWSS